MRRSESLPQGLVDPHEARLSAHHPARDEIVRLHRRAIDLGEAFYVDPQTGLWVMTAAKLWERDCCENACRHCPWVDMERRLAAGKGIPFEK